MDRIMPNLNYLNEKECWSCGLQSGIIMVHCVQCDRSETDCSCVDKNEIQYWTYHRCHQCGATWQNILMEEEVNFLVAVKLSADCVADHGGMSPEDIAYYILENIQSDYHGAGVEFELLEVY